MTKETHFRKDSRRVRLDIAGRDPVYMTLSQVAEHTKIPIYTLRKRWDRLTRQSGMREVCYYEISYAVGAKPIK